MIPRKTFLSFLSGLLCFALAGTAPGQTPQRLSFLQPADSLHQGRFRTAAIGGTAVYGAFSYGLFQTWYKNYDLGGFRTFNDLGEWNQMDKAGHSFTAYLEADLLFAGARWTGMDRRAALWTASGVAFLLQGTVEVMDGFSTKWGFSWSDVGFNALGIGLFAGQELLWQDQRIRLKVSSGYRSYASNALPAVNGEGQSSLRSRATDLFGRSFAERYLKDYNAMSIWVSVNPHSFAGENSRWPRWLNIAAGYGAENLYGGFRNTWEEDNGHQFMLDPQAYPRYRQFFLSPDIDLMRIPTRSRLLRTLLRTLNWVKIPAPALEINTLGRVRLHPLYF